MLRFHMHQIGFKSRSTGNSNAMGMWTRIFGKKTAIDTDNDKLAVEKVFEEQKFEHGGLVDPMSVSDKEPMHLNLEKKPFKVINPDEIDDYMKLKEEHDKKVIAENIEEVSEVIEEVVSTTDNKLSIGKSPSAKLQDNKEWVLEEEADKLIKDMKDKQDIKEKEIKEILNKTEEYKPMPSTAEIRKEYLKHEKAAAKKAKPSALGSMGSHLAKKQREDLREHLTHLKSEHTKMDTIQIIEPPKGRGAAKGDIYIGKKHGYFRITMEVAGKLDVTSGDYLVIANFGTSTLLIGRKPKGAFGYELKAQQGNVAKNNDPSSLFCNNTTTLADTGLPLGNWYIDKNEPQVDDVKNSIVWLKFKHESN